MSDWIAELLSRPKRRVFISYHHDNDQIFYEEFTNIFNDTYDVIKDNSLERIIDSEDPEYVMRRIRENYITGTSCTFVLCGSQTSQRKYVDWEIKATLDKKHGLIGVNLPNSIDNGTGVLVPERFSDNYFTGFAIWVHWQSLNINSITQYIEEANSRSLSLMNNSRPLKRRNG